MKKIASALFLFISMAVMAMPASADTYNLQLTAAGPANTDGIYVYPYTFTVQDNNGVTTTTTPGVAMMCIDFNREITVGESWDATLVPILSTPPAGDNPVATVDDLKALAIIYAAMTSAHPTYTISEYQFAAWSIIIPNTVGSYDGFDTNAQNIAQDAKNDVTNNVNFDYADFSYYDPTGANQNPAGGGAPQRFLVRTGGTSPNIGPHLIPAPEPSSLMLLGTGVFGLASVARRRFKA